ncbi:rhomboid family intramembrane serine protease [Asticcacaulis sp. YBE204]|uniref:rhomboid family intramembrane serine protease n=1 Tax=Asticcacaulis sp. YBE204 TaxID=1282363 RepID=UPI0004CFB0DE|nr:rhomboid family intramembrane serine protease [Asticcacaulis sp. YBE204]
MKKDAPKEPVFNAPWPAVGLSGLILALYALQSHFDTRDVVPYAFGLNPTLLFSQGSYDTLVTSMFLHGSWTHAGFNAFVALVAASALVRAFGTNGRSVALFFIYYLLGGVLTGLIYCLLFPQQNILIIGASGAISTILGAAIRIGKGRLSGTESRWVAGVTIFWIVMNGFYVAAAMQQGDIAVVWQLHIIGFLIGLFSIGVWMRLFRPQFFRAPDVN